MKNKYVISIKQKGRLGNLCLLTFVLLTLVIFLFRYNHSMFILRYVFLIIGACVGYSKCLKYRPIMWQPIIFVIVICVLWLLAFLGQENYTNYYPIDLLYTICYIGLSIIVLENKYNHWISLLLYGFGVGVVFNRIFQSVSINNILKANSRNYISVLLLMVLLLYYISCYKKNINYLVAPAIIYFYVSIYATGRGGIVCGAFLAVSLCIYKILHVENKNLKRILWFIIFCIVITFFVFVLTINENTISEFMKYNFSGFYLKGVNDTVRESIWTDFFNNNLKSLGNFIFGSDTTLVWEGGNLHNSFIQAYASFGIGGFLLITYLVIINIARYIIKRDYLYIILFFALIIRAFTDRLFFQGYCEVFLYYFIFYPYYPKVYSKKEVHI